MSNKSPCSDMDRERKPNKRQVDEICALLQRIILIIDKLSSKSESSENLAVREVSIDVIDPSPYYPFRIEDDEDIENLSVSILIYGQITPAIVREKADGRYEMLSGYRRMRACEKAGLGTVNCEIVFVDDETAAAIVIEANRQRSNMSVSEKGYAYRALKESTHSSNKSIAALCNALGLEFESVLPLHKGDDAKMIQQSIRLTEVIPELQDMVDDRSFGLKQAAELSYLPKLVQGRIWEIMELEGRTFSFSQVKRIRELYENHELSVDILQIMINEEKPNQKEMMRKSEKINKLLPEGLSARQRNDYILKALDYYNNRTV